MRPSSSFFSEVSVLCSKLAKVAVETFHQVEPESLEYVALKDSDRKSLPAGVFDSNPALVGLVVCQGTIFQPSPAQLS